MRAVDPRVHQVDRDALVVDQEPLSVASAFIYLLPNEVRIVVIACLRSAQRLPLLQPGDIGLEIRGEVVLQLERNLAGLIYQIGSGLKCGVGYLTALISRVQYPVG